jgi:hypothetical protein
MTVSLCAFEDLVDVAKPGDRVEVTGIYRAQAMRMKPTQKTLKSVYRTYIDVIHFKRTEKGRLGSGSNDAELGVCVCVCVCPIWGSLCPIWGSGSPTHTVNPHPFVCLPCLPFPAHSAPCALFVEVP